MKHKVFSVFDRAAENYNTPMFLAAKGIAIRLFDDQSNNPESPICQHPEDYILYEIGEFDDENGLLTPLMKPVQLGTGKDFKRKQEK